MTKTERDKMMLDDLFQVAAADPKLDPTSELLARVMADAEHLQPAPQELNTAPEQVKLGLFAQMVQVLGGWRPMAGLATAAVAGLWIGFSASSSLAPQGLTGLVSDDSTYYLTYFDDGFGESLGDLAEDG
ncbi:hypothetical protein Q8W25_06880 [Shimia thalassica]|uniref:hypothetical protein n=1 Tax=Shimia thalassica TaxID=1715693 RepID=UPI0027344BDD|nr:hypothetical protein [Shimia thalassica]MDP2493734.1 hypothetical protein [Shimia thalassica]